MDRLSDRASYQQQRGMFIVWLICLSLFKQTIQEDVVLLLGSDSDTVHVYENKICPNGEAIQNIIDGYPGSFGGQVSALYLDNLGVFVCGGYLSAECQTDSVPCPRGCNWLQVNSDDLDAINHSWASIEYADNSQGFGTDFGMGLAPMEVSSNPAIWLTGGIRNKNRHPDQRDQPEAIISTYVWQHWGNGTLGNIQLYGETEPYPRTYHCLVKVRTHHHEFDQYLEIGGAYSSVHEEITIYHCGDVLCSYRTFDTQKLDSVQVGLNRPTCTTYRTADLLDDIVLVVNEGHAFNIICDRWIPSNFTCSWKIQEVTMLPTFDEFFADTSSARLVNQDGIPHIYGVGRKLTKPSYFEVFKLLDNSWTRESDMFGGTHQLSNLVAVSVPLNYLCYGLHTTTTTTPGNVTTT